MSTLAELIVRIGADARNLVGGLNDSTRRLTRWARDAEKSIGPVMDAIGNAAKVAGTAAAVGFGGLVAAGVQANSSMEQYRATLNTVMADSEKAGETLDWVKQYAAKTPFEMPGLVESTVKLEAMGLQAQKFLPIAGDMAAVFQSSGKTVGDAAEAINDAMMGEFERLKEFGIKLQQTDFKAGGKYAGKTYAEALEAEFKAHNYAGAAEALSKTFAGRLSTLKDTLSMFLQEATGPLFTSLSEKMGVLMGQIDELQASGKLKEWADQAKASFESAWVVIEQVGVFLFNTGKWIYDNWIIIGPVLAGVLAGYLAYQAATKTIALLKIAQDALNFSMRANPIGIVVTAIGLLVAAGVLLYQNWDTIKAKAEELWNKIYETWNNIKNTITQAWESIKLATMDAWNGISVYLNTIWDSILSWATSKRTNFKNMFLGIWDAIKVGLKGYVNNIIGMINAIIGALNNIQVEIPDWVPNFGGQKFGIDLPQVPYLAQGGIVTKPTLAVIGEKGPEAVIPLRGNNRPGSVTIQNINIYGNNADEIWNKFKREMVRVGVKL